MNEWKNVLNVFQFWLVSMFDARIQLHFSAFSREMFENCISFDIKLKIESNTTIV